MRCSRDDHDVAVRENGKLIAITKGVATPSVDRKILAIELRQTSNPNAKEPLVRLDVAVRSSL